MSEPLEIVGRCERCGREFVTLPAKHMIDNYPPVKQHWFGDTKRCGGRIGLVDSHSEEPKEDKSR